MLVTCVYKYMVKCLYNYLKIFTLKFMMESGCVLALYIDLAVYLLIYINI